MTEDSAPFTAQAIFCHSTIADIGEALHSAACGKPGLVLTK